MFLLIKQVFIWLCFSKSLSSIVNTPGHTKCISLNIQQCMTQPTLINLHLNEYIEGLRYYPHAVNLGRCMGGCNTLSNDLSNEVCAPNKTNQNLFLFKFEFFKYNNRNKRVKNINQTHIMQI